MATGMQGPSREAQGYLDETVDPQGPGVATLVVQGGEVVFRGCAGLADLETRAPITPETSFDLASVSKHMTASAILLLASRGALRLGDEAAKHLADYDVADEERPVRLRDLLWHTSGLPDYTSDDWEGTDEEFKNLSSEEHVRWISKIEPRRPPGEEFEFNNSGYALLARVVEEITKKPFSTFVRDELFAPLKMTSTVALDDLSLVVPRRATGYKGRGQYARSSLPSVMLGDGNIFSSIKDLALWENGLQRGAPLARTWLVQSCTNGKLDDGSPIEDEEGYGYGYGWVLDEENGSVSHGGRGVGTAATYVRHLDEDLSIIVLSNNENQNVDDVAAELYTLFSDD